MKAKQEKVVALTTVGSNSLNYYLGKYLWKIVRILLMICLAFVVIYPLVYMCSMAFRPAAQVYDPQIIWVPDSLTFANIKQTVEVLDYFQVLGNTLFLVVGSTVIQVMMCSAIGYGFGRFKLVGQKLLMVVLLLSIVVPAQLISIPQYHNFLSLDFFGIIKLITGSPSPINILDKPWSFFVLALFGQGIRSGIFIMIFRQAYKNMPTELDSAAMVDGASIFTTYLRIMLPNAATVSLIVFLFSFVWYWNDYYLTAIYLGGFKTLSVALANIRPAFEGVMGKDAFDAYQMVVIEQSACLLLILPVLLMYIFTQRYFTESIEKTGIVG